MKTIKSLLLVICFLSAFSVAAYAGDASCYCNAQSAGQGVVTDHDEDIIPEGITGHWYLSVEVFNMQSGGKGYGWAYVSTTHSHFIEFTYEDQGYDSRYDSDTCEWGGVVDCKAQVLSGTGGGVIAQAGFYW